MNKTVQPQWLEWAKELQFIAQGGLTYSKDVLVFTRWLGRYKSEYQD